MKMKVCKYIQLCLWTTLLLGMPMDIGAREYKVSLTDVADCLRKTIPGDRIVVEPGIYNNVDLKWKANGLDKAPIEIVARQGEVIITGKSSLIIAGKNVGVRGLVFKDGIPSRRAVIEFANGKDFAEGCYLSHCVIDNFNTSDRSQPISYIYISGKHNKIEHCELLRKYNLGVTLLVNLNGANCLNNHHRIEHNYFGPREVYGSNGAETIRIGTSQQSYETSGTEVTDNLFDQCSGEVEVISVKSCDNVIRNNYFWECEGVVALRHGKRNLVEANTFIGNNKRNTGGVRVVDADHVVRKNIFAGLAGKRFFSALGVMNAVPNSLPNRYVQVSHVCIEDNVYWNCTNIEFGTGADAERTSPPQQVDFRNNRLCVETEVNPIKMVDGKAQISFVENTINRQVVGLPTGVRVAKLHKLIVPSYQEIVKRTIGRLTTNDRATKGNPNKTIIVGKGDDLANAVAHANDGDVFVLEGEDYQLNKSVEVSKKIEICSAKGYARLCAVGMGVKHLMTIMNGGSLKVSGVIFDGRLEQGGVSPTTGISTAMEMNRPYRLMVDNCKFINFGESSCAAIRGQKSTFADSILIVKSEFLDSSGSGIDLASEKEDKGRYNAENIVISDCHFSRMLGIPINIYRGGSDESTAGPYVTISHCTFLDCCNKQRGSVAKLIGPQYLRIADCQFTNSGKGGVSIRLDETTWEDVVVERCKFENSGKIFSMKRDVYMNHQNIGL